MRQKSTLKGEYIKVRSGARFKTRTNDKKKKSISSTTLSSGNIYPFSSTTLSNFAF
jgi:hypothetical protein